MTASVVRCSFAIDAAFWSAERVTMAGSMTRRQRVDDLAGGRVEAEALSGGTHLVHDDAALEASVERELAERLLECTLDDAGADGLLSILERGVVDGVGRAEQRGAAARDDALLERSAGRLEGVLDAVLLLLHLPSRWQRRP